MKFSGVFTAVVTPFKEDKSIDWNAFEALLADQLMQKVDGIVICGTTGEASTLTETERKELISQTVQSCEGHVPVIAGAGHNNTLIACENQKKMQDLGVSASLQVTPWYNRPSQAGLFNHFQQISESCSLPTILYNVPSRCGIDLEHQTTIKLAKEFKNIVGIKEASGSIQRLERLCAGIERDDFSILTGDDSNILPMLALGGHGVISVISHICGFQLVEMFEAFEKGDLKTARRISYHLIELTDAMFANPNPVPVKAALSLGRLKANFQSFVRSPLVSLNHLELKKLTQTLKQLDYIS